VVVTSPEVPGDEGAPVVRMEQGLRAGVRGLLKSGRLRQMPSVTVLAAMCASAVSPVIATAAGMDPIGLAGMGVLSGLGGGVLSGLGVGLLDKYRERGERQPTQEEVEPEIRALLEQRLTAGDAQQATRLSADIFELFWRVDAGKILAETTDDADTRSAVFELVSAVNRVSEDFAGGRFLLEDLVLALENLDTSMRGLRDEVAVVSVFEVRILQIVNSIAARLDGIAGDDRVSGAAPSIEGCPYLGLVPFSEKDAQVFYGREEMVDKLADKVRHHPERGGLIVVTGVSGAGKSSLLRAGLLSSLGKGDRIPGSEYWIHQVITPNGNPFGELAASLAALSVDGRRRHIQEELIEAPEEAYLTVRQAFEERDKRPGRPRTLVAHDTTLRLLLIVDQFEEVFTLNPGQEEEETRTKFVTALRSIASAHGRDGPLATVILAVRGDYFEECIALGDLADDLEQGLVTVRSMTDQQLRLTITGPAKAANLSIEDGLVPTVLADLRTMGPDNVAGALPLLSVAMQRTWDFRDGYTLTIHGYDRSGGVSHAIEEIADQTFDKVDKDDRWLARGILCQLTVPSRIQGRGFSRRPVSQSQIYGRFPDAGQPKIDDILDLFARSRLIVVGENVIELIHDVLLTEWPLLGGWLEQDRADLTLLNSLAEDAAQWDAEKDNAFLYRGRRLEALLDLDDRSKRDPRYAIPANERGFLKASKSAASRRTRFLQGIAAALVILLLASAAFGVAAVLAARSATRQRDAAISGQLAVLSESQVLANPVLAAQLAAAAWQVSRGAQSRESMLDVLAQPVRAVLTTTTTTSEAVFSPHGSVVATVGKKAVEFWDVLTHRRVGAVITVPGGVVGAAFRPDGRVLATADADGTARLWDVATRRQIGAPLRASTVGGVTAVAFSPDGRLLATAGDDGAARLWDVTTGRQVGAPLPAGAAAGPDGQVTGVAFSPSGKLLATTTLGAVAQLWDVATHSRVGSAMTFAAGLSDFPKMRGVVFSPDGATLAIVCGDGYVRLWNVATQHQAGAPIAATEGAGSVAFFPQGSTLAIAEDDGTIRLWSLVPRHQITTIGATSGGSISSVAVSPGGTMLATVSADGTTRLWDIVVFHNIGPSISIGSIYASAFSPDGRLLATAGFDRRIRSWDLVSGRPHGPPIVVSGSGGVSAVAFSPDGRLLAAGSEDGKVRLWDVASGRPYGPPIVVSGSGGVSAVAFSPDGRLLATGSEDGKVRLWDVASGRPYGPPIAASPVTGLEFSPGGTILAMVTQARTALLWDVATRRPVSTLTSLPGVVAVAFSPDGSTLATAQTDNTARLWDVATGRQSGVPMIATGSGDVEAVTFSHDGTMLATTGDDGYARLWDVATQHEIGPQMEVGGTGPNGQNLAFSPDDATLAAVGSGDQTTTWDVAFPTDLLAAVCSIAGQPLTPREWNIYMGSAPYVSACP